MWSLPAIFIIAIRRMRTQWGLILLAIIGVTFAIAFCTAVPLYTNTIYNSVLQTELYDKRRSMPAFGLLWRYKGDPDRDLSWEDAQPVTDYLAYHAAADMGLPQTLMSRFIMSPAFDVFAPDQTSFEQRFALTEIRFGAQSDIEDHIGLVAAVDTPPESGVLQVMASRQLLDYQGWSLGQSFLLLMEDETPQGRTTVKIPVRISGIWQKKDPDHPYWFFNPTGLLEELLLVQESTYVRQLAPLIAEDIDQALWYQILDGDAFLPSHTDGFLRRLNTTTLRAGNLLPGVELMVAPAAPALRIYQDAARWLTVAMFALSVPALVITVIFLGMVVRFMIQRQQAEIAVLRSRGASEEQTLGIAVCQAILMGTASLLAGIPLGRWMTMQLARGRGFMNFSGSTALQLIITPANLHIGLAIVLGLTLAMAGMTYGL
ncbi:MAG: hypothetical protein P1S60_11640, partial [Anaerolineae bacterium]|nr:hypothetical protein [Anaerolineae bacterium]